MILQDTQCSNLLIKFVYTLRRTTGMLWNVHIFIFNWQQLTVCPKGWASYTHTTSVKQLQFLHILTNTWFCHFCVSYSGSSFYIFEVLISIPLMSNEAEYHFIHLLPISLSSLVKCLFMFLVHFKNISKKFPSALLLFTSWSSPYLPVIYFFLT